MRINKLSVKKVLREEISRFGSNLTERQKRFIIEGIFSRLAGAISGRPADKPTSSTPMGSPYREVPTVDRVPQINFQRKEDDLKREEFFISKQLPKFNDLVHGNMDLNFDLLKKIGFFITKIAKDGARRKIVLGISTRYRPIFDDYSYQESQNIKRAYKAAKDLFLWILKQQKSINPIDIDDQAVLAMKEYFEKADKEISEKKIDMRTGSRFPD